MKTYTKTSITTEPRLVIEHDEYTSSPREWSNLGYFITVDSRYNSPDRNTELEKIVAETGGNAKDQAEHIKMIKNDIEEMTEEKVLAIYPITKYEHSGVSYSLGTAHGFDYSNNGFYIITDKTNKAGAEYWCATHDLCEGYKEAMRLCLEDQYNNHPEEQDDKELQVLTDILSGKIKI